MKKLLLILLCLPLFYKCNPKNNLEKVLIAVVEEVNNSCPMFVDEQTRLEYAEIDKDGFFHYIYTFPMKSKSDVDIPSFYYSQSKMLNKEYESNPSLSNFRDNDVTLRYTYFDMYNNQIISIVVPN
tara:strand:- start:352 stop:729 length:378 start_codon:yes stop_codon:yes gene_type:complete